MVQWGWTYKQLKLQIKDEKDQINPKLLLSEKDWDRYVNKECPKWGYEWQFVKISPRSYVNSEKKTVPWIEITLNDDVDWEVRLQAAWTNPVRFFVNSLCGWTGKTIWRMKISTSAKERQGKMKANLWLNIDGQNGTQLLSKEERENLVTAIKDPDTGEIIKCKYDKLEAFFESKYDEINKKSENLLQHLNNVDNDVMANVSDSKKSEVLSDELPF